MTYTLYPRTRQARIESAIRHIKAGDTGKRSFGNCLEAGDGERVVVGIMEAAQRDPVLLARLQQDSVYPQWQKIYEQSKAQLRLF